MVSLGVYQKVLLCQSFMVMCAMGMVLMTQQEEKIPKCSIEYIRKVIMESCRNATNRYTREANDLEEGLSRVPHRFAPRRSLPSIDRTLLPKDAIIQTKPYSRSERAVSTKYNDYFYYCCEHMEICENLDCHV